MTTITPALRALLQELVDTGRVPGLALAIQPDDGPLERVALGSDAAGQPLADDTLYIVASITKMATALAVLRLVDRGLLALDDQLADHLPSALAARDGVTIRSLLCHASGLPIDIPPELAPYAPGLTWGALAEAAQLTPLEAAPWARVQYSNVGYGLLALVAQERASMPFADLLGQQVLEPLGIEGYLGVEPPRPVARLADVRGDRARDPELQPFNSAFYRSLALPWAGLVTTPAGALAIVRAFAGFPQGYLSEPLRREAVADQTRGLGGGFQPPLMWAPCPWGLGPELRGAKEPHWTPSAASPASFGHSGASGCVAWHDPERRISWALIGARTAENGWLLRRGSAVAALLLGQA